MSTKAVPRPAARVLVSVRRPRRAVLRRRQPRRRPASLLAPTADTFRQFLEQQETFVFFVTVYVGAGLIANDRRANALQIYLSKPLTRAEYVFGKLAILMTFLLLVTWLPAIVLLVVQIAFAGNFTFFRNNLFLFPAITLFSFIEVVARLARRCWRCRRCRRAAATSAILYAAVIFFTQAIYGVLCAVTAQHARSRGCRSRPTSRRSATLIFRQPLQYDTPWPRRGADDRRAGRAVRRRSSSAGSAASRWWRDGGAPGRRADHLSKWYGQVIGLNDVTVTVPPGITGLLGPNGAGKSTFMKLITGQLKPSKGSVAVLGEPIWENPGALLPRSASAPSRTPSTSA